MEFRGAVQAMEDAAALGIIFSSRYRYDRDVEAGLKLYERVRKPRATRVQQASLRATENINERIGFSTQPYTQGKLAATGKLTTDELNLYGKNLIMASMRHVLTCKRLYRHEAGCRAQLSRFPVEVIDLIRCLWGVYSSLSRRCIIFA